MKNNIKNINDFLENCGDFFLTDDVYLEIIKATTKKKKIIITNIGLETDYDIIIKYMDKKNVIIENDSVKRKNAIRRNKKNIKKRNKKKKIE